MKRTLEKHWREREEVAYPRLFGKIEPAIITLDQTDLLESWLASPHAQAKGIDPVWTCFGVLRSPPSPNRPSWVHVTSGLSNAGEFGVELCIETPSKAAWPAPRLLSMMAYNLICRRPFGPGHRWPCAEPIDGRSSRLRAFAFAEGPAFRFGGRKARLLIAVGITPQELRLAKEEGTSALLARLEKAGIGTRTVPSRRSVVR